VEDNGSQKLELRIDGGFRLPELAGEPLPRRVITTTYLDTAGRSLARAGISLRRATEERSSTWQLHLPGGEEPIDLEEPGHNGVPDSFVRLLSTHVRHGSLAPVATLCTRRSGVMSEIGEGRVSVVLDWVEVISGPDDVPAFGVVEVEAVEGGRGALDAAAGVLERSGAVQNGTPASRALWRRISPPKEPRGWVPEQLVEILAHDPGTRLGTDAEDLHRHRVAVRRLRAALREEPLKTELRWIGGDLGAVRDLDVLIDHFREESASLEPDERLAFRPVLLRLARRRAAARRELIAALDSPRYFELLDAVEQVPPEGPDAAAVLHHEARRQFRKLRREVEAAGDEPEDAVLHELRKRAKRVRYAAERAGVAGDRSLRELGVAAKALQDVLGIHQDAVVGEEALRELVSETTRPLQALAIGRLVEGERSRRAAARAEWRQAWRQLRKVGKKTR
jgi:CHAD domain-containing protein